MLVGLQILRHSLCVRIKTKRATNVNVPSPVTQLVMIMLLSLPYSLPFLLLKFLSFILFYDNIYIVHYTEQVSAKNSLDFKFIGCSQKN